LKKYRFLGDEAGVVGSDAKRFVERVIGGGILFRPS
jgi:hypothetical protein